MLPQLNSAQNVPVPRLIGVLQGQRLPSQESTQKAKQKSTLQLWLRSDALNFSNGAAITLWPDWSGQPGDRDAKPGTAPIYTANVANGWPAATFNGATNNRFLTGQLGALTPNPGSETWTLFTVCKMAVSAQTGGIADVTTAGGLTNTGMLMLQNTGTREFRFGGSLPGNVASYVFASTAVQLNVGRYTTLAASSPQIFEKNVSKAANSSGIGIGTITQYRVGRLFQDVFPFNGDILEVGLYTGAMSQNEIDLLAAYAQSRYSIA